MIYFLDIATFFGLSIEVYLILLLIIIPMFFLFKKILPKIIKDVKVRKVAIWPITIVSAILVYVVVVAMLVFGFDYTTSKDFDKSKWFADKEGRFEMASDLIKSKRLMNVDTSGVKKILGEPTYRNSESQSWSYDMGWASSGLGFLFHQLNLTFESNRVISVNHLEVPD